MSVLFSTLCEATTRVIFGKEAKVMKASFYELFDRDMFGKQVPMSKYQGDVLMVVNVASKWGLTKKNYAQMATLADKYNDQGLRILAFPCNQFGGQEPGTHQEIIEFTKTIDPDMPDKIDFFEKANVNGSKSREVFTYLKQSFPGLIKWNFAKFLVDHEGVPYKRYSPTTNPEDMTKDIEALLQKRNGNPQSQ